jgi:hypothetical protein
MLKGEFGIAKVPGLTAGIAEQEPQIGIPWGCLGSAFRMQRGFIKMLGAQRLLGGACFTRNLEACPPANGIFLAVRWGFRFLDLLQLRVSGRILRRYLERLGSRNHCTGEDYRGCHRESAKQLVHTSEGSTEI